jgi:hypothetical protein
MNTGVILLWWGIFWGSRGFWQNKTIFNLPKHEFAKVTYYGVAFAKVCNLIFFLFPYIAIRWVLKEKKS